MRRSLASRCVPTPNGTEVALPRYRAPVGGWKAAITLPDEVGGPMGDAVLAAEIGAGILRERVQEAADLCAVSGRSNGHR